MIQDDSDRRVVAMGVLPVNRPDAAARVVQSSARNTRLAFGDVLERLPDLKVLVAHGGGTLPYLAERLDAAWRSDDKVMPQLPTPPSAYLKLLERQTGSTVRNGTKRDAVFQAGPKIPATATMHRVAARVIMPG